MDGGWREFNQNFEHSYEAWMTDWVLSSSLAGSNNIHTIVAKCIAWHSWGSTANAWFKYLNEPLYVGIVGMMQFKGLRILHLLKVDLWDFYLCRKNDEKHMLLTFRPLKGKKKIMRLNVNEDKDVHTNLVYVDISSKCEVSIFDKKSRARCVFLD